MATVGVKATYVHLSAIDTPVSLLTCDYVDVDIAKHCIESFYNDIVTALCQSCLLYTSDAADE